MSQGSPVRKPAFAGSFYAGSPAQLTSQIDACFAHRLGPGNIPRVVEKPVDGIVGLMVPHAGYMYSGPTAAWAYAELARAGRPGTVVILGPNHQGLTFRNTVHARGSWETPLGTVRIDADLAAALTKACPHLMADEFGQSEEHSIEVQVPFLQRLFGDHFSLVPIMVTDHAYAICEAIGQALAETVPDGAAVIASTDMTHWLSGEDARAQDHLALEKVEELDARGLGEVVARHGISMCGVAPTMAVVTAVKARGATAGQILKYTNSGDITGDQSSVVAYAAARFE